MGLTEAFYEFFIELSANNQKSWFDENRARYEREVKALFLTFVESVLVKMVAVDGRFSGMEAKQCIFRINKDIRFSKDKTPYKLHCAAAIQIGGRKEMDAEDTLRSNFDDYVVEVWKASKGFNAFLQKGSIG